jgi:hypothetical protein
VRLAEFLNKPLGHYEQRGWNDFNALKGQMRKGDVLLIEGDQRVSSVIKYLTQSSWSHAAIYIGDELLQRGGERGEQALASFGDESKHMMVEALFEGVVASPLTKYVDFNVRLCRPNRLRPEHLEIILDDAVEAIGWHYDVRNILELAFHLVLVSLFPSRYRRDVLRCANSTATEVICTSLLGRLFHKVRFPVLPSVTFTEGDAAGVEAKRRFSLSFFRRRRFSPRQGVFTRRHHTLLTPRDFDLSPYFDIVKFNVIEQRGFDYQQMEWADDPQADAG